MSLSFEQVALALWWSLGATELLVALLVAVAFLLCALHGAVLGERDDSEHLDWRETLSPRR